MEVENLLADLIKIQSVNPPGGEIAAAKYLKHLFDEYRIPNEIIESSPGRGSFLAYLGDGGKRLLYLSHTDVVPAADGWTFDPFSGEIKDGFVYGRGALDCKGLAAAEAWVMLQLAGSGQPGGRLIFAATADEETGGNLGVKHLVENDRDKIMADFAINEGGRPPLKIGDKVCHFTQIGEKGICWTKLKTRGRSAHGSLPMLGDNAITKMAEVIKDLANYQPKIILIPEVKQLIQTIAELQGLGLEVNEPNLDQVIRGLADETFAAYLSAATRMTISTNVIRGGVKGNVVPDSCEADLDIRVLPGQDREYVAEQLSTLIGSAEMEIRYYHPPTFSTSDSEHYRLILATLKEVMGEATILPCISAGSTDSKFLREVGIPCYGISMMARNLDPAMSQSVHGRDEKIDIESLRLKADFLLRLAQKYLGNQANN